MTMGIFKGGEARVQRRKGFYAMSPRRPFPHSLIPEEI